jgi:hypothetical protein
MSLFTLFQRRYNQIKNADRDYFNLQLKMEIAELIRRNEFRFDGTEMFDIYCPEVEEKSVDVLNIWLAHFCEAEGISATLKLPTHSLKICPDIMCDYGCYKCQKMISVVVPNLKPK